MKHRKTNSLHINKEYSQFRREQSWKILKPPEFSKEKINNKFYKVFSDFYREKQNSAVKSLIEEIMSHVKKTGEIPTTTLKYYKIIKLLGKGSFGKVYLGLQKLTNRLVAIKTLSKTSCKEEKKKKVLSEINIFKKFLGHPHIIQLLEVFENDKFVFFVMEFASSGDLLNYVKKKKVLDE